ncbi:hypothetical protein [Microbacterium sp. 5K110]|uniref:DUF7657 domain-containing protein n=1 Tax=unclassified Microbacterium TaxID=2609290 RepID=UPI0010FE2BD0|nr:hypothetical protein [Microbacterium sp. 5K110]TLF30204.1 hypothetical protein FE256_11165 [Microbacterium sp. 5K110]
MSTSKPVRPWRPVFAAYGRFVEPRTDGLPNAKVVGIPLGFLAAVLVLFVALGLTGSSTGVVHGLISETEDPALIAGEPAPIRSDEWFVQTSWVISQVEQGLPPRNETFPGGMDATVQNDLPTTDWSTALRPHLLGFFVLPLDQAMAMKWWLPGFAVIAAGYLLAAVLMPRRPLAAAALAVGFFFSPFFQWWYLSTTLYPAAWAFLVMATAVWCLKSRRRRGAWILAGLTAWTTAAMAVGVYAPFIVPVVLVAAAFVIGLVLTRRDGSRLRERVTRIVPLLAAGLVAAVVMVVWLLTRWSTIEGFTSTVYPGERLQEVGHAGTSELAQLFAGFLSFDLGRTTGAPFAMNAPEASTFFLPGLFLVVAIVWVLVALWRTDRRVDGTAVALLVSGVVMVAFLVIPGWDPIAHLFFLDRTTYGRIRIGFGVLSFVLVPLTARLLDDMRSASGRRAPWWVPLSAMALVALSFVFVLWRIGREMGLQAYVADMSRSALLLGAVLALLCVLSVGAFARGWAGIGAAMFLIVSVVSSLGVNPLYRGVLDLRETATVRTVQERDAQDPGTWVGITSTSLPTMMLLESGVTALNGFQGAPSREMWSEIDPTGAAEEEWNRLGMVSWVLGEGDPAPRNPYPDQVQMTFDACAPFAREHVTWVLSEVAIDSPCVVLSDTVQEGPSSFRIYEVVK